MEQPFDLGHEFNWNGQVGVVGKYPFGLPCNVKITGIYYPCIILAGGFYGLIVTYCTPRKNFTITVLIVSVSVAIFLGLCVIKNVLCLTSNYKT